MSARGATLVELLVGSLLALLVLGAGLAGVAAGGQALARLAARAAADETMALVTDALRFDVRQAGFDPRASGIDALATASDDRLVVQADLDGDGRVDGRSTERIRWSCRRGARDLQRVVGRQSMPLASELAACGFEYLDADGRLVGAGGTLDAADRRAVRVVVLAVALTRPSAPSVHRMAVALRMP